MIVRMNAKCKGIFPYLDEGRRNDMPYLRYERDHRIFLLGDYAITKSYVDVLEKYDQEKINYLHIVFSSGEIDRQCITPQLLSDYIQDWLEYALSGYEGDEYLHHVEMHMPYPYILHNDHLIPNTDKYPHAHLVIPTYSPKNQNSITINTGTTDQPNFELLQRYLNNLYGFEHPLDYTHDLNFVASSRYGAEKHDPIIAEISNAIKSEYDKLTAQTMANFMLYKEQPSTTNVYIRQIFGDYGNEKLYSFDAKINMHTLNTLLDTLDLIPKLSKKNTTISEIFKSHIGLNEFYEYAVDYKKQFPVESKIPNQNSPFQKATYFLRKAHRLILHYAYPQLEIMPKIAERIAATISRRFTEKISYSFSPQRKDLLLIGKLGSLRGKLLDDTYLDAKKFKISFLRARVHSDKDIKDICMPEFSAKRQAVVAKRQKYARSKSDKNDLSFVWSLLTQYIKRKKKKREPSLDSPDAFLSEVPDLINQGRLAKIHIALTSSRQIDEDEPKNNLFNRKTILRYRINRLNALETLPINPFVSYLHNEFPLPDKPFVPDTLFNRVWHHRTAFLEGDANTLDRLLDTIEIREYEKMFWKTPVKEIDLDLER